MVTLVIWSIFMQFQNRYQGMLINERSCGAWESSVARFHQMEHCRSAQRSESMKILLWWISKNPQSAHQGEPPPLACLVTTSTDPFNIEFIVTTNVTVIADNQQHTGLLVSEFGSTIVTRLGLV